VRDLSSVESAICRALRRSENFLKISLATLAAIWCDLTAHAHRYSDLRALSCSRRRLSRGVLTRISATAASGQAFKKI
jgi:hypothetical protein